MDQIKRKDARGYIILMRRYRLAIVTFIAVFTTIMVIGLIGGAVLLHYVEHQFVSTQLHANLRQAQSAAKIAQRLLELELSAHEVIERIQTSTEAISDEHGFICLWHKGGTLLCHPDPSLIGTLQTNLLYKSKPREAWRPWNELLKAQEPISGFVMDEQKEEAQILYSVPIVGTDWIVSSHEYLSVISSQVIRLGSRVTLAAGIIGFSMALSASGMARLVSRRYEKKIEAANAELENQVQKRTQELQRTLKELRTAHERLVRGEKMHLLGELMSGIIHEIRSPLSSITLSCGILVQEREKKINQELITGISEAAKRIANIISNMLAFAKEDKPSRVPESLNTLCTQALELIGPELQDDRVNLELVLQPDLPLIELDPQQIQQVILNLINNARQAFDGTQEDRHIRVATFTVNEEVILEVSDNGPGIPSTYHDEIFQPFFTTKKEGTGLGLSLCKRFVEAHDGTLQCNSSEEGASFRVHFNR